jgi:hypothetical protein
MQEVPVLQALLQFVRFGLPWDLGRTITIAHGDAGPVASPRAVVTCIPETAIVPREAAAYRIARAGPGEDTANGEAAREQRALAPQPSPQGRAATSAQPRRGQISNVGIWECRQYPGLKRTRASANTSGPDFTLARRPPVKLRSSLRRAAPNEENLFLLPDRA